MISQINWVSFLLKLKYCYWSKAHGRGLGKHSDLTRIASNCFHTLSLSALLIHQSWNLSFLNSDEVKILRKTISKKKKNIKYLFIHSIDLNIYVHFYSLIFRAKKGFWNVVFLFVSLFFLWLLTAFLNFHNFYCTYFKIVTLERDTQRYQFLNMLKKKSSSTCFNYFERQWKNTDSY